MEENLTESKVILRILKVQLNDVKHPLKIILEQFKDIFVDSYKSFVDKSSNTPENLMRALTDLNQWEKS